MPDRSLKSGSRRAIPAGTAARKGEIVLRARVPPGPPRRRESDQAMICHAANALPLWGLVCATLIWAANRERSRFLAGQALQAMYFHGLLLVSFVVWMLISLFTRMVIYLAEPIGHAMWWLNLTILVLFVSLHVTICAWGAWKSFGGMVFRYPLVGEWLDE